MTLRNNIPEYSIWKAMRNRCKNNPYYKNIHVCERWDNFGIVRFEA
jgi:hypothetical protein